MRCIGVDFGAKRWGLSYGDELGLAVPLPAATAAGGRERFAQLEKVLAERRAEALIVGYPYNMDGTVGFKAREVDAFIAELERRFRLPVHRVDERLTSHQAAAEMRAAAPRRARSQARTIAARQADRASGALDSRAATLILQDFLDAQAGAALLPPDEPDPE